MANATPTRLGQANLAGDAKALFLQVFGGEVFAAFDETNVALKRSYVRTITQGKSASFPLIWKGGSETHVVGTEITGSTVGQNERVISIDDKIIAPRFVADIDEAMNHFDVRQPLSRDVGMALAGNMDRNIFRVMLNAARASANITGANGGTVITAAGSRTNASTLIDAVFAAAAALDAKDIPADGRTLYLTPTVYYLLINSGSRAIDVDLNPGGNGSVASGRIYRLAGMEIVKTNNLPQTDVTTGLTKYQGNFTNTTALIATPYAAGTVKLMDVSMQMQYDVRRQGTLILGRYAVGHDILRPDCAVEITNA